MPEIVTNPASQGDPVVALPQDHLACGDAHWLAGRLDEALACYLRAASEGPLSRPVAEKLSAFSLIRTAQLRIADGDIEVAVAAYQAFLCLYPAQPEVLCELGLRLFQLGRVGESIPLLRQANSAKPALQEQVVSRLRSMLENALPLPAKARHRFYGIEQLSRALPWIAARFQAEALPVAKANRAVCIAGMHRSGTSMIAQLMQSLGVDLGPEERLFAGKADNPDGFFESREVVLLHDELLNALGGGWDSPPTLAPGWERSEIVRPFRERAALLAAALSSGENSPLAWGWKDPRSCFTLPLWFDLIPELKVIVVVRDPGSVASSLQRRGGYSTQTFGLKLWQAHYENLLDALAGRDFLVVSYDRFFEHTDRELARMAAYLGWSVFPERIAAAKALVRGESRHHQATGAWRETSAGFAAAQTFDHLLESSVSQSLSVP